MPRPLDGRRQLSLVLGLGAGDTTRENFTAVGNESSQQFVILPIDMLYLVLGKITDFLPPAKT
jgi:hypothetical protein